MQAIRVNQVVEQDGEIFVTGLPCRKGEIIEMILLIESPAMPGCRRMTARQLLRSGLIGLWKDRKDIGDSTAYARQLREQAQRRRG